MNLIFSDQAWEDYLYWQRTDQHKLKRINTLILTIQRIPYEGIGKPERLKYALAGYWSRRIDQEHRLVYKITEQGDILLAQVRYHY